MKSTLVEFARFKNLGTGVLRQGDDYLRTVADLPVQPCEMPIDQRPFNKLMRKLRYLTASEQERQEALREVSELSTEFLGLRPDVEEDARNLPSILEEGAAKLQQLDLVANAAELSALPFEAALGKDGNPLFLSGGPPGPGTFRRTKSELADTPARSVCMVGGGGSGAAGRTPRCPACGARTLVAAC